MIIDKEKKKIKLSVKDFIYANNIRVHKSSQLPFYLRSKKGIKLHQYYQKDLKQKAEEEEEKHKEKKEINPKTDEEEEKHKEKEEIKQKEKQKQKKKYKEKKKLKEKKKQGFKQKNLLNYNHKERERRKTAAKVQNEVSIKIRKKLHGWNFEIKGRADCLIERKDQITVEEIKSTIAIESFTLDSHTAINYCKQLQIYGYYFAELKKNLDKKIQCNLVLIELGSKRTKSIEIPLNKDEINEFFLQQAEILINQWKFEQEIKNSKKKKAITIKFPFKSYRPHQQEIIDEVNRCLKNKDRLILSAPTGLGKTIGSLLPALKFSLENNKKLFIVTSKTTQQKIYEDTLLLMEKRKSKFNAVILTAKEKMCINSAYICDSNFCQYIANYEKKDIPNIIKNMLKTQVLEENFIRKMAREYEICPFELALDCSLLCDVIVGDFNYVFDPKIRLRRFFDNKHNNYIVIIDEAHNLPERAKIYYSPELSSEKIAETRAFLKLKPISKKIRLKGDRYLQNLQKIVYSYNRKENPKQISKQKSKTNQINQTNQTNQTNLTNQIKRNNVNKNGRKTITGRKNNPFRKKVYLIEINQPEISNILDKLDDYLIEYTKLMAKNIGSNPVQKDDFINFVQDLHYFEQLLDKCEKPEFSQLFYPKRNTLKIFCKSASEILKKQMKGFHSVITQSATLFPMEYFRFKLGFPEKSILLDYPSPFPKKNHLYLSFPYISTRYRDRPNSYHIIAGLINSAVNCKIGNYLAFFPVSAI